MTNEERHALNRTLYRRLKATFGHVKVKNSGEAQTRKVVTDLLTGRKKPNILNSGEYYTVCCPFCNDTRFRLYINHRYGSDDEFGRPQVHLATCFNAGCPLQLKDSTTYQKLQDMLLGHSFVDLRKATITQGVQVDVERIRSEWPGTVVRIDQLDESHVARQYLVERGFDPVKIGRFYNVHWCSESTRLICREKLIIPIYLNKKMVGWQARPPFDCDWKKASYPKYYTAPGTPRKNLLYNLRNAANYRTGIITEGVTDVWRIGPQGVCTLGATLTEPQQQLFIEAFKEHAGVLLFDPDVKDQIREKVLPIVARMNSELKSGFCWVNLPEGKDPGSMPRKELRAYIAAQAAKKGVNVDWSKR